VSHSSAQRSPHDKDLYELPPDEAASIAQVPGSLTWIAFKRAAEIDPIRLRPHR